MALSNDQIEVITILVQKGDMSNRAIAKEAGCSESAVRTAIKKHDIKRNALKDLAQKEVQNTIIANEIKTQKNALSDAEKNAYTELLLEESQNKNLLMNTAQKLLMKVSDSIEDGKKLEKVNVGLGMQELVEVGHGSSDHLNHAKTIDQIAITLKEADRHAPKGDTNVSVQTNQVQAISSGDAVTDAIKRKFNS